MPGRAPQTGGKGKLVERPSSPLLPQRLIRRQFLLDTLQEASLLLPIALCALGLIYLILYAPILGGATVAGVLSLAAGLFWAARLLWRAGIHYQQGYTRKLQELALQVEAESARQIEAELQQAQARLEQGFQEAQAQKGLKILRGLENEHRQLQQVMARGAEADLLSTANLAALVQETYVQGLNVLEHALELEHILGSGQEGQLQNDLQRLEQKAATAAQNPDSVERMPLLQEQIGFHKERLSMLKKMSVRLDELLYQAGRCEASLCETRMELAVLKADASEAGVASVISTLQKTIERAKEVQAELKKLGY